jgi:hypothetical protein
MKAKPTFDIAKWNATVSRDKYGAQTRHPNASRTVAELQDIANAAEEGGETLNRADFTPYDWQCLIQFVLTIRELPGLPGYAIAAMSSSDDLPEQLPAQPAQADQPAAAPEPDGLPSYAWAYRNEE